MITTALSTSMPIASIIPIIEKMLSVSPRKYIAASVISSEPGTASATIAVIGQSRRKKNSTPIASTMPIRPASRRSPSELRMLSAWLPITMMLMPCSCGSVRARSISLSTASTVSTTFACVVLNTSSPTAGRLSRWRPISISGATSATSAMSASRTAEVTRRFLMSSSERNSPIGRMLKRWPCSVISPALTEKLLFCSSVASCCTSMLCAAMRPALIRMRTSRGTTPCSSTRATPGTRSSGRLR